VILARDRGTVTVYEARGSPYGPTQEGVPLLPLGTVVHPSKKGLFALLREGHPPTVRWAELAADATPRRAPAGEDRTLAGLDADAPCVTALSLEAQTVFVLGSSEAGGRRLLAFTLRGEAMERSFDVEVPVRVTLAQDEGASTVLALSPHEQGVEVVRLGASPPVFQAEVPAAPPLDLDAIVLSPRRPCAPRGKRLWGTTLDGMKPGLGVAYLYAAEPDDRREMIDSVLSDASERSLVVPRFAALWKVPKPAFAEEYERSALARFPGDPEIAQIPAHRAALAGDWAAVRDRLAPIDPTPLGDAAAQHHDHLLGAALLMTGDAAEARRVLLRGAARAGGWCDLSTLLALAGEGPEGHPVRALDRALRSADA
jgi:hypothetical protein